MPRADAAQQKVAKCHNSLRMAQLFRIDQENVELRAFELGHDGHEIVGKLAHIVGQRRDPEPARGGAEHGVDVVDAANTR